MKRIISIVVMVVVALIAYNTFYGTEEDKARGKEVTKEAKDLFGAVVNLFKAEKDNFDNGKYDNALDKINTVFSDISSKANELGGNYPDRVKEIEDKLNNMKMKTEQDKTSRIANPKEHNEQRKEEMNEILTELKNLTEDMEKE